MEKKTECEIVQDLLLGYIDNTLNNESKKLIEKHLSDCKSCRDKLKEIKEDIKENENNQKKEIDYLKKVRIRSKIKSVIIAICIIIAIILIIILRKFFILNNIVNKAEKSLQSNNIYKETRQSVDENSVAVFKEYYKDGKYKLIYEVYSDNGVEPIFITYATEGTDERYTFIDGIVRIQKSEVARVENNSLIRGSGLKTFKRLLLTLKAAFTTSISTSTFNAGREYYILSNSYENPQIYESWIDKETGLKIKEINRNSLKSFIAGTNIVKNEIDLVQEYKYEFDVVTDEDVTMPDISNLEKVYSDEIL